MTIDNRYRGIIFMVIAALGFSVMGGAAKILKGSFTAGQLVFYRNAVGLLILLISFALHTPKSKGGKTPWLVFRGLMGTVALYSLLFCILHIPLGTAFTYNLTSTLFIAVFGYFLFGEYHGKLVLIAVLLGFVGMVLIYKPSMYFPWYYHLAGLISGVSSALAYLTVGRLAAYYESRIIVLAFLLSGVIVPVISMLIHYATGLPEDEVFILAWRWPVGMEWLYVCLLGFAALFGQFFVTKAYGVEKAGIVSAVSYSNIIFSIFIGMLLGDAFPDLMSLVGITCIIVGGIIISLVKRSKM
jgi:drug/metabolite transporter (DMT)-like permease